MAEPAERMAVYEDLLDLPENVVGELIDGVVCKSPRPRSSHAHAASRLGARLIGELDGPDQGGPDGWQFLFEPELHLGAFVGRARPRDQCLVPDIAGWRRSRMPVMPDVVGFELPPDWLCEVLSPSTERRDRVQKLRTYAAAGVRHVWLLSPAGRFLEVFALNGDLYTRVFAAEEGEIVAPPFEMGRWFLPVEPDED